MRPPFSSHERFDMALTWGGGATAGLWGWANFSFGHALLIGIAAGAIAFVIWSVLDWAGAQ